MPPKVLMFNIIQMNKLHALQTLLYFWQFSHAIHSKVIYSPFDFLMQWTAGKVYLQDSLDMSLLCL